MNSLRIGVIGGGNMAEAILRGGIKAGVLHGRNVLVSEPRAERRSQLQCLLDVRTTDDNPAAVQQADVVLLAVKPQVVDQVMAEIAGALRPEQLLVSVAAGITISRLARHCPAAMPIIRTMPNTPMLVGRGMIGIATSESVSREQLELVLRVFEPVAECLELPEDKLDAVTAVSGSGPAYFFLLVEALTSAGVAVGLSPEESRRLAAGTFAGAARLLEESDVEAAELRRRVTSPGGTTAAALEAFAAGGFSDLVQRAVQAAADRSRQLGNK